jgi:hypothetical protein
VIGLVALSACARAAAEPGAPRPARGAPSPAAARPLRADGAGALELFRARVAAHPDLDYPELARRLALDASPGDTPLSFDPTSVAYFEHVAEVLKLTDEERAIFRREGLVSVDHKQRLSMGLVYNDIYTRDLPVLITSDSILHALHRTFDAALEELELLWFADAIADALAAAQDALVSEGRGQNDALTDSLRDVDLYFTVARNLFAGEGAPADDAARDVRPGWVPPSRPAARSGALPVAPRLETEATVRAVLARIAALKMDDPNGPCTALYGGRRCVDFSQFRPRGHYSKTPRLRAYFRALTWLGRADLGWNLGAADSRTGLVPLVDRERRDAALTVLALSASGRLPALAAVSGLVDFLVGASDDVGVSAFAAALSRAGIKQPADVGAPDAPARIARALAAAGARGQQITSQVLVDSNPGSATPTEPPLMVQLFGQRFVLDSFVEAQVVYDTIVYQGEKQRRLMPSGLDVMAALGDGEAVRLLEPELRRFNYASNLLAARETVDALSPSAWKETAYNGWLSALRALHDPLPAAAQVPQAMRRGAWRRKQLQTELASWTELRHDTILYSKQSYTIRTGCSYPAAYVEPVPTFYDRVGDLTRALAKRLEVAQPAETDPKHAAYARTRDELVAVFARFADTTGKLATLARKELAARPFTKEEADFLKKTIDIRGGGSGGPHYDGWYPKLILGLPAAWKPTVADVHTDPNSGDALEEAVGDAMFMVVAIDNRGDRAAYVGPVYSYYELTAPAARRMTDEEWQAMLGADRAPPRPAWTAAFAAPPVARELGR